MNTSFNERATAMPNPAPQTRDHPDAQHAAEGPVADPTGPRDAGHVPERGSQHADGQASEPGEPGDATAPKIVGSRDGEVRSLGSIGVRFMVGAGETHDGGFSLVEHPMPPRTLAAPLHRHSREDEYSYVLEGRMGALLGDAVVYAEAGDLVHKPRNQWHTFWNAGDEPCRLLEIISPGGFEDYFQEVADAVAAGPPDPGLMADLQERYGIEHDVASIPALCARFGLVFGR